MICILESQSNRSRDKLWILAVLFALVVPTVSLGNESKETGTSKNSADKYYKQLIEGNRRYVGELPFHANQDHLRRKETTTSQHPGAVILSCSDSRVPPELIFDQGIGDIFVVRVAGNVATSASIASIEYAIEHLGSSLIVVMGHESCGAVKAALNTPASQSAGSADLDALLAMIRPSFAYAEHGGQRTIASSDPKIRDSVKFNVDYHALRLTERSAIIREAVKSNRVKIIKGIYSLETGKVDFWQ